MKGRNGNGKWETSQVPPDVRQEVLARDRVCRACGRYDESLCLHHVLFRSQGGLHVASNLVSLGWSPIHDCHLKFAHGPDARLWRELLQEVIRTPGITGLQLKRWRGL